MNEQRELAKKRAAAIKEITKLYKSFAKAELKQTRKEVAAMKREIAAMKRQLEAKCVSLNKASRKARKDKFNEILKDTCESVGVKEDIIYKIMDIDESNFFESE